MRVLGATVATLLLATLATAQSNPIDGNYGNAGGCQRITAPNAADPSDETVLLRPDRVETYFASCMIRAIELRGDGSFVLDTRCGTEDGEVPARWGVIPTGDGGFVFQSVDGAGRPQTLRRCSG